jgi:hypothetical protein
MNSAAKLAAFAAAVAATFGGAMAVGAAVGPIDVNGDGSSHGAHSADAAPAEDLPRGLAVAEAGYRFAPEAGPLGAGTLAADTPTTFAFRIVDTDGMPVTGFQQLHERALHLIVLSRNLVDYLHLHPTMDANGRWTVELPALAPGSYRVFADFQPVGAENLTLGTDLTVPGDVPVVALPHPATIATVDGYTVSITGSPAVGEEALSFTVQQGGSTVHTDPYLGAAGHLVAIRAGDLAYLHVHPETSSDGTDPSVTFMSEFPTPGTYRLFFDFSHDGAVHTAAFTVAVPESAAATTSTMTHSEGH